MAELSASTTNKPYPDYTEWLVQMLLDDGTWGTWLVGPDRDKAV